MLARFLIPAALLLAAPLAFAGTRPDEWASFTEAQITELLYGMEFYSTSVASPEDHLVITRQSSETIIVTKPNPKDLRPFAHSNKDLKPFALRAYGVRCAYATGEKTVVVVLGAASGPGRASAEAYRITSDADPAYAYEKFVRPVSARIVEEREEFPFPEGFKTPDAARVPLLRTVVELTLPHPLRLDTQYGLVAIGENGNMVTAAKSGCEFFSNVLNNPDLSFGAADAWAARMVGLRHVSPVGDGKIVLEFGAGFSPPSLADLANFSIAVNGKPMPVLAAGRRSKIDVYKPEGWPFKGILQHDVFLDIGHEFRDGDRVEVRLSPRVTAGNRELDTTFELDKTITRSIQANQVGYLPDGPKIAYLACWMGSFPETPPAAPKTPDPAYEALAPFALRFHGEPSFDLVDTLHGKVVFTGKARLIHNGREKDGRANHSASNVYLLDFSSFKESGHYYLRVDGVGRSLHFLIHDHLVYAHAFVAQARGVYEQRCGCELDPKYAGGWRRVACHVAGVQPTTVARWSVREFGPLRENAVGDPIPLAGGHHDAGDYNPRSHLDVAQTLLSAWEHAPDKFRDGQLRIPEDRNGLPDIVDEALWALRAWTALQDADGGVRAGTESAGDPNFVQTVELDDKGDFAYAKDCRASFNAAGAFAQAARVLRVLGRADESAGFLARARRAYAWGVANPPEGLSDAATLEDCLHSSRAYAAAELLHTTGEPAFLDDFRACTPWAKNPAADMTVNGKYDVAPAAYAYLRIPAADADPALRRAVLDAVRREADMLLRGSRPMAYQFIRHPYAPINWGTGAYGVHMKPILAAWLATGETVYRDALIRTCDNMLGANPLGLSWIVGLGQRTIRAPLHNSRYRPAGVAVDGIQAEGPNGKGAGYNYKNTVYPQHDDAFAVLHSFIDAHFAIAMDEGMVPHQALAMALFGLLQPDDGNPAKGNGSTP